MEILLATATILGGIAAVWYFWEKWQGQNKTPASGQRAAASRTAAVVHAQARAYGVLMGENAAAARAALKRTQALVAETLQAHGGQVDPGRCDSLTARFEDSAKAVAGAMAAMRTVEQSNREATVAERVHFRFGIDAGKAGAAALGARASTDGIRISEVLRASLPEEGASLALAAAEPGVYTLLPGSEKAPARPLPAQLEALELPLPSRPSLMLMPFAATDDDPRAQTFATGLRLDIQNALIKMSGLFLIAAGAGNALRGVPAAEAGQRLGVRHALECTVQHLGDQVRVHVQLVDAQEDRVVWSEQYDRKLDAGFALQDEIAERVVTALDVKLASGEQARVWRKCLTQPRARDHYYQGMQAFFQMNAEAMASARAHFERLAEVQPDSPHGPTMVAFCLWLEATRGWAKDPELARRLAGEWAERACALQDSDGQAQTVLGNVRLLQRRHDEALRIAREATGIRPGCTNANAFLGNVLLYCGDPAGAAERVRRAIRLSPVYPPWFVEILAAAYRDGGQGELAAATARELLRIVPGSLEGRVILAGALAQAGDLDEARSAAAEVLEKAPAFGSRAYADRLPYRDDAARERIVADLEQAGLPA